MSDISLEQSSLWKHWPEDALMLWGKGYRPMPAEELKEDRMAALRVEYEGLPSAHIKEVRLIKVHVSKKHDVVMIRHSEGDEAIPKQLEVWSK